ncbi:uncharacterized protein LOC107882303 [Acyrthosiphon pisum]|uniref:Reverse transcriptase n=1 Tax=Acyrthosiphon pisum TaxID=7029 RepID=A0A8R2D205_ACYPI|nr:uncharacterized protein LOC107882303 [Acyrthosiphon pisum]|eukprot:XP_016655967.1 PREDICTED: uncharacterized protein LOC107882303 [Acyrthosiphon pisum]
MASKRNKVKWKLTNDTASINHMGIELKAKNRRNVMRTMRNNYRAKRSADQGRAMECAAAHPAATNFLRNGDYTRFADWRFIHRARPNLVPLNGSAAWRTGDRRCRRCDYNTESLAHVVDHCMRYSGLYLTRHNAVVERIKTAASTKFEILFENQMLAAFDSAARERLERYHDLSSELATTYGVEATVIPFVVGALGGWYSKNDEFLHHLCSPKYAVMMRKLCVSEVIGFSRDIYIQHLTNIPQRSPTNRITTT